MRAAILSPAQATLCPKGEGCKQGRSRHIVLHSSQHTHTHLQQFPPQLLPAKLLGNAPVHFEAGSVEVNIAVPRLACSVGRAHTTK